MKVLITGGNGFIGRCLVRKLLLSPDLSSLHIIDDLSNSNRDKVLSSILKDKRVQFSVVSVKDFEPYQQYTHIFHLASPVGPAGVLNYAGRMANMIVGDACKMAHYAIAMGAKMLDISTSEVYGYDPGESTQAENVDKIVPSKYTVRLEYGVAKLACEIALLNLANATNLNINIVRPFNIVGIGQKGEVGFVLPRFVQQALNSKSLTAFGDGNQKRCFTSVNDIADAILKITNSGVNKQIFNIGNPINVCSINNLAEMVIKATKSKSDIIHIDPKTIYGKFYEEAWNKIPDITKIKQMIKWEPQHLLVDIINEIVSVEAK